MLRNLHFERVGSRPFLLSVFELIRIMMQAKCVCEIANENKSDVLTSLLLIKLL